jgi:hypothetical protein
VLQNCDDLAADRVQRLLLSAIDGIAENDIYIAGSQPSASGLAGRLFHSDGSRWQAIELPEVGALNAIHIENDGRIWLCGHNGALLVGNHRDGFKALSADPDLLFHDLTIYNEILYLGSLRGLYARDRRDDAVRRVATGLSVERDYVGSIDHADGILWCVGPKDITRFDGARWTRIHHPDNPRIGDAASF